jgi:hypothetical protein
MKLIVALVLACLSMPTLSQSVPAWAIGRDGSNRLQVNGGVLGTVTFASEYAGSYPSETENLGCTPTDRVAYNWTFDGYAGRTSPACRANNACPENQNSDLAHPVWKDTRHRHVLVKNWNGKNAFKTINGPHVDVTQVLDSPGWGGWFVAQDTTLKNSDDGLTQWQFGYNSSACGTFGGQAMATMGGVLVQGLSLGYESAFAADCAVRESLNGDPCTQGNFWGTYSSAAVLWIVNLSNADWPITLQQTWQKVIVVGSSLPNISGGNGGGGAFGVTTACTGSPCSLSNTVWGPYADIETALAAGHAEPPFIRLSCTGWSNTANCAAAGGGSAPSAPTNFRTTLLDTGWLFGEFQ